MHDGRRIPPHPRGDAARADDSCSGDGMRNLDYTDIAEYIPAFLCVAFTAFTFNIANGISVAFISFVIMKVAMGRTAELHKGHYLLALLLAYYFYAIAGVK